MYIRYGLSSAFLALVCVATIQSALATDASAKIKSPTDGAKVAAMKPLKVEYEVSPGPTGDHVHLYVDDKNPAILRQLLGTHTIESLSAGPHKICIKVVTKAHVPIGVDNCVMVTAE